MVGGEWLASCPWYPLGMRLGGLQSLFGHDGKEQKSLLPLGIKAWLLSP